MTVKFDENQLENNVKTKEERHHTENNATMKRKQKFTIGFVSKGKLCFFLQLTALSSNDITLEDKIILVNLKRPEKIFIRPAKNLHF